MTKMRKKLIAMFLAATVVFGVGVTVTVYAEGVRLPILPSPGCGSMAFDVEPTKV